MLHRSCFWLLSLPWVVLAGCGGDEQCRTDNYPAAQDASGSIVHVSAGCPADGADGSAEQPYRSIREAVDRASAGATVLIAPGEYAEQVQITKDVSLVGSSEPTKPETAGVVLTSSDRYAIVVSGGEQVVLQGLHLVNPQVGGVKVTGAAVTIEGSWVEGAMAEPDGLGGYGVVADHGSVQLQNSIISGSAGVGVLISNARGLIQQNRIDDNDGGGVRLQGAVDQVTIQGNTLRGNALFGIAAFSSTAIILQNRILDTGARDDTAGDGILVSGSESDGSAEVVAQENVVSGSSRTGILCNGDVRTMLLQNNTVSASGFGAAGGGGVWLQHGRLDAGAASRIEDNEITGNRFAGISMTGETNGILLQKNTISGTVLGARFNAVAEEKIGDGITLSRSASGHIEDNIIADNGRFGVILDSPTVAGMSLQNNRISHRNNVGIILQNAANFSPGPNEFKGSPDKQIQAVVAGTHMVLEDDLVTAGR